MPTLLTSTAISGLQFKESAAPTNPASGYARMYVTTSGVLMFIDDTPAARVVVCPTGTVTRGDCIIANSTPAWAKVALGATGKFLRSDGTDLTYSTITIVNAFAQGSIPYASTANTLTALAVGTLGQLLGSNGTIPVWSTASFPGTASQYDLIYASAANVWSNLTTTASRVFVTDGSGVPAWRSDLPTAVTIGTAYVYRVGGTDVAVADGGTGLGSYTVGDLLHATATGTLAGLTAVAAGQVLTSAGTGTVPAWSDSPTILGLVINGAAATSRAVYWRTANVNRWIASANATAEAGANAGSDWSLAAYDDAGVFLAYPIVVTRADSAVAFAGAVSAASLTLTTKLAMAQGGTGAAITAVNGGVAYSNASTLALTAVGTSGQIIRSAGAAPPVWTTATYPATITSGQILIASSDNVIAGATDLPTATTIGTAYVYRVGGTDVAVADGGTGLSSYAVGDLLYASATGTIGKLADVAVGQVLTSGGVGVAPAWSTSPSLAALIIDGAAETYRSTYIRTANVNRWIVGGNNAAESGANAGTNFTIVAYDDAGSFLFTPFTITRSTGVVTLSSPLPVGSGGTGLTVYAVGDLLYASATGTLAKLADVAAGQFLISGGVGVAPAWSGTAPTLTLTGLTVSSTSVYSPQFVLEAINDTAGAASYNIFQRARAGTTAVQNGDTLGTFLFKGYQNSAWQNAAYFMAQVTGVPSGDTVPASLLFALGTTTMLSISSTGTSCVMTATTGTDVVTGGATGGTLYAKSSSKRVKEHIEPWGEAEGLLELQPVLFDYKGTGAKGVIGLVAEDVERLLGRHAVNYGADGLVESFRSESVLAALVALAQRQQRELDALKRTLN